MKKLIEIAALAVLTAGALSAGVQAQPAPTVGTGAGFHDPRSPIKPLQEREGVLAWALLSSVSTKVEKNKLIPVFPAQVRALDKQKVRVQGFMMPLEPGDKQQHFLLSAVPTSCAFCVPAGPEGLIEVRSKQPVRYSLEAITLEGQLSVLSDDPYGMFYRLTDGQALKP
ncbi:MULTISPECIES: DUF3299 domain-containing protein [Roseateles]|uniref:DUF3299 domain-containing protein n=1 Tax=Roseateles albus TaxID=2987525 RepID=A0ABT5KBT3_9BURK|nr:MULTISPECIES: DUF3299 domain-containing protein [Roseateles]MCV2358726.1 DUF3299 domain-containing protein [Paucibacter sp. TC2R-5]MDC8771402.1 DUF3299 domain-containing protein [Roseateles albus]